MNKIDIVIPTYHRREKLINCLGSIEQARTRLDCYSYIYVYYSDTEDYKRDNQCLRQYKNILPRLLEKPYKASTFWNDHLKESTADVMVYLNDDVILEINCLLRLNTAMDIYYPDTDGLIAITQDNIPEDQACKTAFGAIGTKFADRFPNRKVMCEDYERFYFDQELGEYAQKHNKLFHSMNRTIAPLLTHLHPAFFKDMMDETHSCNRIPLDKDKTTYNKRRKQKLLWGDNFTLINE
jgi:hypothetical protein